ncbi:MAG: ParM/StbA family protein [Clostridium sp.]|nr:ParM/StbA family protein [Clostridium sp.]
MKHYNDIVIVGIDHGYGNIKTAQTVTPTGIMKLSTEPTFTENVLFYEDGYYRIGEGHKEFISDKWQDNDFYLLTLMGIARELKQEGITSANVHLAVGLPLTWVDRQREDFRRYMLQKENIDFKFAEKLYSIRIVGCSVYPQGYAAVVDKLRDMTGVNMLADIGNGTVNIMYINNRKPISTKSHTEKMGVNQCVISASNAVLDKLGVKIDDAIIQQMIRYGKADIADEFSNVLKQAITEYANGIFDMLRRYEYNPKLMRLYITGGGGKLIENFGTYERDRVTIIGDICASAKGYEQFALMKYRKDGRA